MWPVELELDVLYLKCVFITSLNFKFLNQILQEHLKSNLQLPLVLILYLIYYIFVEIFYTNAPQLTVYKSAKSINIYITSVTLILNLFA